jgi:putative transcriptional regulator
MIWQSVVMVAVPSQRAAVVSLIDVQDLTKTFKVRQRSAGTGTSTGAALRRLLRPGWELREAVSHVSFTLDEGEIVGYLGPKRCRQVDHDQVPLRDPGADLGLGPRRRPRLGGVAGWDQGHACDDRLKMESILDNAQGQLAEAMGVSRQTINSIENDRYTPSLPLAIALARYFGRPVEEVFHADRTA